MRNTMLVTWRFLHRFTGRKTHCGSIFAILATSDHLLFS